MSVEKSIDAYKNQKMNCAQSILKGFQENSNISDEQISEAKKLGAGRAENGLCGALFAAKKLAQNQQNAEEIEKEFAKKAGSQQCRTIRKKNILSCGQCVELAAELLSENSK